MPDQDATGLQLKTVTIPLSEYNHLKEQARVLDSRLEGSRQDSFGNDDRSPFLTDGETDELLRHMFFVYDDFGRGLEAARNGIGYAGIVEGLEMVMREMGEAFAAAGVTVIDARPGGFDPRIHQVPEPDRSRAMAGAAIAEVLRAGFARGGRVLRRAVVSLRD